MAVASPESQRLSADMARKVLLALGKWKVAPSPINYHLIYEYIRGKNDALVRDVQRYEGTGKPFTNEVCEMLYSQHVLSELSSNAAAQEAQRRTQEIIHSVLTEALSTTDAATRYGEQLSDFSEKISNAENSAQMSELVRELLVRTGEMAAESARFKAKLDETAERTRALEEQISDLRDEARTDTLTGLPNRRALDVAVEQTLESVRERGMTACVAMLDADHFKSFNDTYGHAVGDQVLRLIADAIKDKVKSPAMGARFGGEEFTLLLPDTGLDGAVELAERLREGISKLRLKRARTGETLRQVTVSIGISVFRPTDTAQTALERADSALYAAKEAGRNRVSHDGGA